MNIFDKFSERTLRGVARSSSRRSFLGRLGLTLVGGAALPLLPIARASAQAREPKESYPGVAPDFTTNPGEEGDVTSCDYWRYCGVGGTLCSCCGGGPAACPPGTEMSPMSWIGTCLNPVDNKHYIISYNDCCGKPNCTRCPCAPNNPKDRPSIRPQSSSEYLWCIGTKSSMYTCSTATVVGLALAQEG
ncbi:methylamine dehydrogenase light chain [Sphingosinicella microcystinivorans]|uniref:methylamine dehydrogenase light chain n=1 Tax=Sphingosinicella microcystinivorans TaxID=335406 RepID=UPI0022F3F338|nr:methylamine dehydrogenase light chain [Sphingosinicella microcystinivorans]WBX84616.1 methylamine dehydrogenase light chain [Sphingosinicella microcystinivorans]